MTVDASWQDARRLLVTSDVGRRVGPVTRPTLLSLYIRYFNLLWIYCACSYSCAAVNEISTTQRVARFVCEQSFLLLPVLYRFSSFCHYCNQKWIIFAQVDTTVPGRSELKSTENAIKTAMRLSGACPHCGVLLFSPTNLTPGGINAMFSSNMSEC